jgi:cytochrome c oxidase subunit II
MIKKWLAPVCGIWLATLLDSAMGAESKFNLQTPQSVVAHQIYDLHTIIFSICVVIFVIVFGAMFYAVIYHRKSVGHKAAHFHESTTVEILWTVIPFIILIGMAVPATHTVLNMRDSSAPELTIKATGYQWKWSYEYLKGEGEFAGQADGLVLWSNLSTPQDQIHNQAPKGENYLLEVDNPLVVPVGKKVRVLLTANDVIHAFWVPAFGVKQDAIPGFIRDIWFKADEPGTYRGQCAELCGKDHGFMPIVVIAMEPEKYIAWAKDKKGSTAAASTDYDKKYTLDELKTQGEKVYMTTCVACHQPTGKGMPPAFPALAGGKIATGPKAGHLDIVVNGSSKNPMMVPFGKQLSDLEIAAVITYERNSFGNKSGEAIQPAEVKAARK